MVCWFLALPKTLFPVFANGIGHCIKRSPCVRSLEYDILEYHAKSLIQMNPLLSSTGSNRMGCESRMFTDIFRRIGRSSSDCTDRLTASVGLEWSGWFNFLQPEVSPLPVLIDCVIVQTDLPFLLLLFAFSIEKALSRVGFWMVCIFMVSINFTTRLRLSTSLNSTDSKVINIHLLKKLFFIPKPMPLIIKSSSFR